jgi:hypothetical protein
MRAADHIERNPHLFEFLRIAVPECGSPGCAIGWVGHFAGQERGRIVDGVCTDFFGVAPLTFYERLDKVYGSTGWQNDPAQCASALRLYAAKYLAPPKPVQPTPDWNAMADGLSREPTAQLQMTTAGHEHARR